MAKTAMFCPFSHRLCSECPLYRGRHYYLSACQQYRGHIGQSKANAKAGNNHHSFDFQDMWKQVQPWVESSQSEAEPKIKLTLIDAENGEARTFELEEAKAWDWDNPMMMRVVGDLQITSWDKLAEIVRFKASKGHRQVDVYEAPRFMLLGGG